MTHPNFFNTKLTQAQEAEPKATATPPESHLPEIFAFGAPVARRAVIGARGFVEVTNENMTKYQLGQHLASGNYIEYVVVETWEDAAVRDRKFPGSQRIISTDARHKSEAPWILEEPWTLREKISSPEEIKELVEKHERHVKNERAKREKEEKEARERRRIIKEKLTQICPSWAKAIIVAEYEQNESDSMTDYFSTRTERTILLGFSKHNRDIFSEMRKACENSEIPEIRAFLEIPTVNSNNEEKTESNKDWWNPTDEHREKYSMGAGYYLKKSRRYSSGWAIRKYKLTLDFLDDLELDEYIRLSNKGKTKQTKPTAAPSEITITINEEKNGIEIRFPGKPAPEVLETLKNKRWRWSGHSQAWYNRNTPENMEFAKTIKE